MFHPVKHLYYKLKLIVDDINAFDSHTLIPRATGLNLDLHEIKMKYSRYKDVPLYGFSLVKCNKLRVN